MKEKYAEALASTSHVAESDLAPHRLSYKEALQGSAEKTKMDYTKVVSTKDQEVGPAKGSGPNVEIPFSNGSIGSTIGVPPKMQYQTNGSQEGYMSEDCLQNAEGTEF
ncbi:hypothetical protein U1Q18_041203, partial [Sarracenia purpurea var. burkii]